MKAVVIVALFAFVAVQLCHSAPMPEDEKKEETSAPPAGDITHILPPAAEHVEVKSDSPSPEVSSSAPETTAKPEEKKP